METNEYNQIKEWLGFEDTDAVDRYFGQAQKYYVRKLGEMGITNVELGVKDGQWALTGNKDGKDYILYLDIEQWTDTPTDVVELFRVQCGAVKTQRQYKANIIGG